MMRSTIALVALGVLLTVTAAQDRYHPESERERDATASRNTAENTADFWYNEARLAIAKREALGGRSSAGVARNVIMFLGDGMSVPTLSAARTLLGQRTGGAMGEEAQLSFEAFPTLGLAKTYCLNAQVADSACTATAYLCGVKANQGTLGVTGAVPRHNCNASLEEGVKVSSIAEWALADGRDVGIVTTTRITHASPAGAYAKSANRGWENDALVNEAGHDTDRCPDIAEQLINMEPGSKFKVILGGGRRNFRDTSRRDEEGTLGRRTDGRDLILEWGVDKKERNLSHAYVWHARELRALANNPPDYLLGLFEANHLQYNMERDPDPEPSLAELTEVAIRSLSRNPKGFFLFVEGGRIDHAHHDNFLELALDETIEMAAAVTRATEMVSQEDSLIVVTADHAHVMSFNGYSQRGRDILGTSRDIGFDGLPYMTLSYTNGPGARTHVNGIRPDVSQDADFQGVRWRTHAEVPLASETHGGDDVAVFAIGMGHKMFSGLYEQSQIPHLMAYAACIGPGPHAPACLATQSSAVLVRPMALTVLASLLAVIARV